MPICLISAMAACADGYTVPSRLTEATTGTAARWSGLRARSTSTSGRGRDILSARFGAGEGSRP
jgi:hypothetical protein